MIKAHVERGKREGSCWRQCTTRWGRLPVGSLEIFKWPIPSACIQ